LLDHPLLRGIDSARVAGELARITVSEVRKGTSLNAPWGDRALIYLVLDGQLRAYQVTADGRELLLELIPAGGFDGLLASAGKRGHFTEALSDATVASLELRTLERLINAEPRIAGNFVQMMVDRLERREEQLETVVLHDPDRQIASQLLALAETLGRYDRDRIVLDPRITHQMLADMLGVRRETVTLHLGKLAHSGAVTSVRGRLSLDLAALTRIVSARPRREGAA
jgi:CRP-like cAMP-binding protein